VAAGAGRIGDPQREVAEPGAVAALREAEERVQQRLAVELALELFQDRQRPGVDLGGGLAVGDL
jgi:hypothetical protein